MIPHLPIAAQTFSKGCQWLPSLYQTSHETLPFPDPTVRCLSQHPRCRLQFPAVWCATLLCLTDASLLRLLGWLHPIEAVSQSITVLGTMTCDARSWVLLFPSWSLGLLTLGEVSGSIMQFTQAAPEEVDKEVFSSSCEEGEPCWLSGAHIPSQAFRWVQTLLRAWLQPPGKSIQNNPTKLLPRSLTTHKLSPG